MAYLHLCPFLEGPFDIHLDDRDVSFPVSARGHIGGAGVGEMEDICVGRGFVWEDTTVVNSQAEGDSPRI